MRTARVGGLEVAFLGMTYGINHADGSLPAGIPVVRLGSPHHPPDWSAVEALVAKAGEADLVVLLAHWGFEYEHWPAQLQREHAVRLVELGVDVILGASPHVLQPVEVIAIDGADPECPLQAHRGGLPRFGVIAWSLGNFATIMPTLPCRVGALLELGVGRDERGTPAFSHLLATPTYSARGLGRRWLDGYTCAVDELVDPVLRQRARLHARAMLGPIITDEGAHP